MDFGSLLYAAQKNEKTANKETKCYRTKFEPPKKVIKSSANLSVNIQNYLKKRDEEEKRKAEDEKRKKEELLALRSQDRKAYKRVQTMLKRTKSANKSVMEDAIDDVNTAVTMAGPQQCDEDDYGYVSQEASAFYAKLMDKYSTMPPEEPKFPQGRKAVVKDLNAAKDRVRAALQKEEEEEMLPHKRKRKSKSDVNEDDDDPRENEQKREPSPEIAKPKKFKKAAPPPMDFSSLLKLAEQKQFEPVAIEKKVKEEDDGRRPMTKKEKMEFERERERRERQQERERARKISHRQPETQNRIPRISEENIPKEKPNGILGRIPKKNSATQLISNHPKSNEGLKRKDSVDSDNTNRNHAVIERKKSSSSSEHYSQSVDQSRNKYHVKDEYDKKMSDRNAKTMSSPRDYDRNPSKSEYVSISSNKVNSRRHDISDEDVSDQEHEKSSSRNNTYEKERQQKSNFSKSHSSKPNEKFSKSNPGRKRQSSYSDDNQSDSQPGNDRYSHKQKYSSSTMHKKKPEVKYKPTDKKVKFSDRESFERRENSCSDNDQSDPQRINDYDDYNHKYSSTPSNRQKPEAKYKPTMNKHKFSDRDSVDNRRCSNSDNDLSDSQSGNDSSGYKQRHSNKIKKPDIRYIPSEKKPKLSDGDSYSKSRRYNIDNDQSNSQSGNDSDSYKHSRSRTVSHKSKLELTYIPTKKKLNMPGRDSYERSHYTNSDNDQSDNYGERSNSPIDSDRDRHRKSCSDSESEPEKKYVPSKKENIPKKENNKTNYSRDTHRRDNGSNSPSDERFNKVRKSDGGSISHSEHMERNKYEATKKSVLNKEKKIDSLFEDTNEKNYIRKSLEPKSSKSSQESDRCKFPGMESKFKIPKSSSQSNSTKMSEHTEKYRSSDIKSTFKSLDNNSKVIRRDTSGSSWKPDNKDREVRKESSVSSSSKPDKSSQRPVNNNVKTTADRRNSNSKSDIENQRVGIVKNNEKSNTTNSSSRGLTENHKKPTLNAEEALKKNANVWAKPCNQSSPKPTQSGLSESQIQRLREMNKKPTPSRPNENPRMGGQGRPSLLKAAAAHAAARAASQTALNSSREAQKESSDRQQPLKTSDRQPPAKPSPTSVQSKSKESGPDPRMKQRPPSEGPSRQFPPGDVKPRQFPPNDLKPRTFPPKDVRPRQFPPPDVKRRPKPSRRIEDDSEDEYDSEMDDFIDDGTDMNQEQISKEIQSIFGYDKSRYAGVDEDDDECMESNFGQIDREEYISLRIGAKEDYEELMKDLAEKERKKKMKKQMIKQRR